MNACEQCGQADATIQYTEVARGQVSRVSLCRRCAESKGLLGDADLGDGVDALLSGFGTAAPATVTPLRTAGDVCTTCGLTWPEFQSRGVLGCEHCYRAFAMQLTRLLREEHDAPLHVGSGRRRASDPESLLPELRALLEQAVREEDYETAAQLRDRIQRLQASAGEGEESAGEGRT